MNDFDKKCLDLAIAESRKSLSAGNYPVGATLALDDRILGGATDTGKTSGIQINHAESTLFRDYAKRLLVNGEPQGLITIYSTLEPCLMCLGTAAMSKANRIVYIQTDPHGGACGVDPSTLGGRYHKRWPEILQVKHSDEPRQMICEFLENQIKQNIRVEWSKQMLDRMSQS